MATQLRDRLIRQPKSKGLIGWRSYYRDLLEESPAGALLDHRGPYLADEPRHTRLIESILAGARAVLVSAPAGCGKSRFALELARRLERAQRSWSVRFVRQDEPALVEELRELPKATRLILIVDDAHGCPALVERLAAACAGVPPPLQAHLICLTRPAGRTALLQALANHFPRNEPLQMDLGRPDPKAIRELIAALIPQLSPHHRDVIRRFVADSFFATVLLCSSVARQKKLPQTLSTRNLRDYAVRQPIIQAIGELCPPEKAFRALAVYAACAPVPAADGAIRSSAATHAALTVSDIDALERRVMAARLFETDGRGLIRPSPGLVGDLILEETCLDEQGRPTAFAQSLLRALFEQRRYRPVISNCGEIARLFSSPECGAFLGELLPEQAAELSAQSRARAAELLEGCADLAASQPALTVRLLDALSARGILWTPPAALEPGQPGEPELHAQRLLLAAAESDAAIVPRALEYSRQLLDRVRADDEKYGALYGALAESCQFAVARPLTHAAAILDVLKGWSEGSDARTAEMAASLVRGFLRLERRTRRWEQDTSALVSIGLDPADGISKIRDQAIDILLRCATHAAPAVAHAAADSLRHWAQDHRQLTAEQLRLWEPQLGRELDVLAQAFARLGATTPHLPVRAAVEQQGWNWWTDGAEPVIRGGGGRILRALPEADTYSLWKALHAAALPIFPQPLDESLEPEARRERLSPALEPSGPRAAELARQLLDRLDPACRDGAAWSALFASALTALPRQPLQPRARLLLQEFAARHPEEAWSLVTEQAATGPLAAILPSLLVELRGRDTQRWHGVIQNARPGTSLFEMELNALCATGDLDSVERAMVAKGLELDDAEVVHLASRALLSAPCWALAPGLSAVLASLPRRSTDVRLWELTLEAFARWADHLLTLPPGEEPEAATRDAAGELLRLLRTSASSVSWAQGPHTRRLAAALAIFAVAVPHTLKAWIWQDGMQSPDRAEAGDDAEADRVLSSARFCEAVRLLSQSSAASFWRKQLADWIIEEPELAALAAKSLAQLCGLSDPCVVSLVTRLAQQPADSSSSALRELVSGFGSSPRLIADALELLRQLIDAPQAYGLAEKEIIATMVRVDGTRAGVIEERKAMMEAVDGAMHAELSEALRQTLLHARQAIQGAIEEDLLRGEAH